MADDLSYVTIRAEVAKNGEARDVPLAAPLRATLAELHREKRCEYGFHNRGRSIVCFKKAWRAATVRAGLPGKLFHDLRRSFVRNAVRAGVTRKVAMGLSGHKTGSVFDRYDVTTEDDLTAAMDQVVRFIDDQDSDAKAKAN